MLLLVLIQHLLRHKIKIMLHLIQEPQLLTKLVLHLVIYQQLHHKFNQIPNGNFLANINISNIDNIYANPSSVIYSLSPSVAIGELIVEKPPQFNFNKLLRGTYNELRLQFLGTDLQPVQIKDPNMTILLTIRDLA